MLVRWKNDRVVRNWCSIANNINLRNLKTMLKTTFFDVLRFENEEAATEIFTVEYTEDKMKITCPGGTIEELPRRSSAMNQMHPADHKVLFCFLNIRMEELV